MKCVQADGKIRSLIGYAAHFLPPSEYLAEIELFHCNTPVSSLRQGSNERDSSSPTERVSPVILSAAKDLSAERDRPFASLRVTRWDSCNGEGLFFTTEPCLMYPFRSEGGVGSMFSRSG